MRIHPAPQGSDEWKEARLGLLTASEFDRIITSKTRKPSAAAKGLILEKVAEWAMGCQLEDASSGMMERGNELEEEAARSYAFETDSAPAKVGLCLLDDLDIGASPDRLVDDDGLLEIKNPGPKAMVGYLLDPSTLEDEYRCQVQGQLWVTGRSWCDLYAHHPTLPAVRVRVLPDGEFIDALSEAARDALEGLERAKATLRARGVVSPLEGGPAPVARQVAIGECPFHPGPKCGNPYCTGRRLE